MFPGLHSSSLGAGSQGAYFLQFPWVLYLSISAYLSISGVGLGQHHGHLDREGWGTIMK